MITPLFGTFIGPWRRWFAWHPVKTVYGEVKFLTAVMRRRVRKHEYLSGGSDGWWLHQAIDDIDGPELITAMPPTFAFLD